MEYYVWLSLCFYVGSLKTDKILMNYAPKEFYNAIQQGRKIDFLSQKDIEKLKAVSLDSAKKIVENTIKNGYKIICHGDLDYPEAFYQIKEKPVVLYVDGILPYNKSLCISVIGSREVSDYALFAAANISYNLAISGVCVVSGFAMGADSAAHLGALYAKGSTIAILGCGLDISYPHNNNFYRNKIQQNGCRITEYPLGTAPVAWLFPKRNRLLAGLCEGVFVAQARANSGALITVNYAMEFGKDVFVIPDNIFDAHSKGTTELLKDGAIIISKAEDILAQYAHLERYKALDMSKITTQNPVSMEFIQKYVKNNVSLKSNYNKLKVEKNEKSSQKTTAQIVKKMSNQSEEVEKSAKTPQDISYLELTNNAKKVYDMLSKKAPKDVTMAEIMETLQLQSREVMAAVTELELENLILATVGRKYSIA